MTRIHFKGFFQRSDQTRQIVMRVWYPIEYLGLLRGNDNSFIQFTEIQWEIMKQNKTTILEQGTTRDYFLYHAEHTRVDIRSIPPFRFTSIDPDLKIGSPYHLAYVEYQIGNLRIDCYHPDAMLWILERSDEIDEAFETIKGYETNTESFIEEQERVQSYIQRFDRLQNMYHVFDMNQTDPAVVQYIEEMMDQMRDMATTYADRDVVYADLLEAFYEFNRHYFSIVNMNILTTRHFSFMMSQEHNWKFVRYTSFDLLANVAYNMIDRSNDLLVRNAESDAVICLYMETLRTSVESFLEWDSQELMIYLDYRSSEMSLRTKLVESIRSYIVYFDIPRWKELYDKCMKKSGFRELARILSCFVPLSSFDMVNEGYVVRERIRPLDIDRIVSYTNATDTNNKWILLYILRIFYYIDIKRVPLGDKSEVVYSSIGRILKTFFNINWTIDADNVRIAIRRAIYP